MFKFFDLFFKWEWKIQCFLMNMDLKSQKNLSKIPICSLIILIIVILKITNISTLFTNVLMGILIFVFFLYYVMEKSIYVLTTMRGFFKYGIFIVSMFVLFFIILIQQHMIAIYRVNEYLIIINITIITIIMTIVWTLFSTMCNINMSTLANLILTVVLGIFYEVKNLVINFMPNRIGILQMAEQDYIKLESMGFTETQLFSNTISMLLFPLFFMFSTATVFCAIKKYWIEKYNSNNDIKKLIQ